MKCPVDGAVLQMAEREGVEIDYCPECRGVWLDARELDRILERSMMRDQGSRRPEAERRDDRDDRSDEHGRDEHGHDRESGQRKRKDRLSFLGDLLGGD